MSDTLIADDNEPVLAERRGAVLLITLNRPDRLNAWNDDIEVRYGDLLEQADDDPEVRAIVVTGAGRGFCAGADMDDLGAASESGGLRERHATRPRTFPLTVRKPLIAAINGAAAGLGLVEALFCDVRFATPTAKLTTAFARRGLIAEYGMAWLMPRIVGFSRAMDLLMSGRIVLGEEAAQMGLVDRVVDPESLLEETLAYAQDLAESCSPTSMAVIKDQVHGAMILDFDEANAEAERLMAESFGRADVREGVDSYVEKRGPAFDPLPPRD